MSSEPTPMTSGTETAQGRSFSWIDAGALGAVLLATAGVVWSPKLSGAIAKATGSLQPITVMVDVRGIPAADPTGLVATARADGKVNIVIRNQPHGSVAIEQVVPLARRISTLAPDGRVLSAPDPNQAVFGTLDARFVLRGEGRKTAEGIVFGNQSLKIGAPIELEGSTYRVGGTVSGLKLGAS